MWNAAYHQLWHDMWYPPWSWWWLALHIMNMECQLFQPHNNCSWAWHSPNCFYDLPLVLLGCNALTFQIWKLGGHPGLVTNGKLSKGLEASQLSKAYAEEREHPFVAIGTMRLQVPILHALKLVPIFTPHMLDTTCQSSTYFFLLPLRQRLMSLRKTNLVLHIAGGAVRLF